MKRQTTMITRVKEYLAYRRSLGFALQTSGIVLLDFGRYADKIRHRGPLTAELALQWATSGKDHTPRYQAARLSIVRGFARYLAARDGRSQVPDRQLLAGNYRRQQPHVYADRQLRDLLTAAAKLAPVYALRPESYRTLFGLLAGTGLRVSEALRLRRDEVDLRSGVLRVSQTKFCKSRLVPMHPTVARAMRRYAAARDRDSSAKGSESFFVGRCGRPLPYGTVRATFRRICNQLRWRSNGVLPRPRIHDLRHTFACRRLLLWYRQGIDVDRTITSLSTYIGHGKVTDIYWYLGGTGELLSIAGSRFERFALSEGRDQ
jgi:integrase